jgi:hypothetical protein
MRFSSLASVSLLALSVVAGCAAEGAPRQDDDDFSSNQATLLDFDFDGSLETDFSFNDKQTIQDQLLYTVGHLNTQNSVGRLDNLVLTNIKKTTAPDGKVTLTYHAKLPVAWGSKTNLPTTYDFILPKDVSFEGQSTFTESHKDACVDFAAHDVTSGNMWYYYRPLNAGCRITDAESMKTRATIKKSTQNTTGKFPEYQKVWEDNRLEVISIFGKFEDGGGQFDAGVQAYSSFLRSMRSELRNAKQTPAEVGPDTLDVTFEATLADGKQVKVTALLVDAITNVWEGFDERYESLTPTADLIAYNGHAGLGQNVRALARKGKWNKAQYQIFFMNGCDTFAYVDGSLAETRAALNSDDPTGTKYMEFVTNAMPSFFHSMSAASTAIVKGLMATSQPLPYDKIFEKIDRAEVVLVTGEEDNVFQPGMKIGK